MANTQRHIVFRIVALLIVAVLLVPTGIKLLHTFEHEAHSNCDHNDTANFHECEIDCVFLKYNLQQHHLDTPNYSLNCFLIHNFEIPSITYGYFYNHRILAFSLRGPPTLV